MREVTKFGQWSEKLFAVIFFVITAASFFSILSGGVSAEKVFAEGGEKWTVINAESIEKGDYWFEGQEYKSGSVWSVGSGALVTASAGSSVNIISFDKVIDLSQYSFNSNNQSSWAGELVNDYTTSQSIIQLIFKAGDTAALPEEYGAQAALFGNMYIKLTDIESGNNFIIQNYVGFDTQYNIYKLGAWISQINGVSTGASAVYHNQIRPATTASDPGYLTYQLFYNDNTGEFYIQRGGTTTGFASQKIGGNVAGFKGAKVRAEIWFEAPLNGEVTFMVRSIGGSLASENFVEHYTPDIDINTLSGASLRIASDGHNGIRFSTVFNKAQVDAALAETAKFDVVGFGTLIVPADYLADGTELSHAALAAAGKEYLDVEATGFYEAGETDSDYIIHGAIADILDQNYARKFIGTGYVKYTAAGNTYYIYGSVNQDNARSIYDIAVASKIDEPEIYADVIDGYLNAVVNVNADGTYAGSAELKEVYTPSYSVSVSEGVLKVTFTSEVKALIVDGKVISPSLYTVSGNVLTYNLPN